MMWSSQNRNFIDVFFRMCLCDAFEVGIQKLLVLLVAICGKMKCCNKLEMYG